MRTLAVFRDMESRNKFLTIYEKLGVYVDRSNGIVKLDDETIMCAVDTPNTLSRIRGTVVSRVILDSGLSKEAIKIALGRNHYVPQEAMKNE